MSKYKPYYTFSIENDLAGLGAVSVEIEQLIDTYGQDQLNKIIELIEAEKNYSGTWDFDDIDALYNRGITVAQKKAWVYYKRKTLGIPMLGGWKQYYLQGNEQAPYGTEAELKELVKQNALFYVDGEYLPLAVYTWGNMYEREQQLEADREFIIMQFGQDAYQNHYNELQKAKPEMIRVDDPDETKRAVILPISTIAKTFTIKEVRPEYMKEVEDSEQSDYKGKTVDKKKRINLSFDGETKHTLQAVFIKWLYTLDRNRNFSPGIGPFEVVSFYLQKFPMSKDYKENSPLSEFEVKKRTEEDGNRLFSKFINEVLVQTDIERINYYFNNKYNSWSDLNSNAVPVAFEVSREFNNGGVAIKPEKREAVAYMETVGSGILAYDVGVGKTMSALLELANALYQGKCKRPLVVVPNPTYKNWIKEAFGTTDKETGEVFQGILSGMGYEYNSWYNIGEEFVRKNTELLTKKVNEKTVTFITYEGFLRIGFSQNVRNTLIKSFTNILEQQTYDPELKALTNSNKNITPNIVNGLNKKDVEDAAELFGTERDDAKDEKKVSKLIGKALGDTVCDIDTLGFDYIVIDEAHRCKKAFTTVNSDIDDYKHYTLTAGTPSKVGLLAFCHTNYIQQTYGRNIMLLTATPFTNSPLEIYSMLSFVGYDLLLRYGYYNINDFFKQFANKTYEYVVTAKGTLETREIIKGYNNRLILQKLIFTKINYKTGDDVGVKRPCKINLPMSKPMQFAIPTSGLGKTVNNDNDNNNNGKQVLTYLEMNDMQADNQEYLYSLANSREAKEDPSILLRVLNASLDNAFSPYLFKLLPVSPPADYKEFVENSPKIHYAMLCIASVKKYHESKNEPVSGQVIYSNRGVDYFKMIKQYLIKEIGYKQKVEFEGKNYSEVEIIEGSTPQNDREFIKDAFNAGVVKVIIGSATIREGINLQKNGTVLYDLYPDWNPTDFLQLTGRIWRQGNRFGFVRIAMPLVENSMDVFIFQKLEEKTARINDIFYREGKSNIIDLDSFDPEEIKYALVKDVSYLTLLDFDIERQQAKQSLTILAEDYEAVKTLAANVTEMENDRKNAVETLQTEIDNAKRYIDNNYNQAKNDKELKKRVDYVQNLINDINAFLNNPTDDELLMRFALRIENYNARVGYSYNMNKASWRLKYYVESVRTVRKKERTILKPKGFSINDNLKAIETELEKQFNIQKDTFNHLYGESNAKADWVETVRWKEIYDNIIDRKQRMQINGQPPQIRAAEFATLNYLLDYKMTDITAGQCAIPMPGQMPVQPLTCPPIGADGKRRIDDEGLKLLTKCIEAEPNTKLANTNPETGQYNNTRKALHDKIIADVKGGQPCQVQNQPIAIFTGGAPGSGKTTFLKKFADWANDPTKIVKIDADLIREKLPEYKGWNAFNTHQETRDIVNKLLNDIGNPCEHDIIYDGTMNKADNYKPLITKLKGMGYKIFIIYIEVPKEISIERAMKRYQNSGRYVPIEVINEVYDKGTVAYEELIKNADGYIRVNGITQTITQSGGIQLPNERNYTFTQQISQTTVAPGGKIVAEPTKPNLKLFKFKAKAVKIKLLLQKTLNGLVENRIISAFAEHFGDYIESYEDFVEFVNNVETALYYEVFTWPDGYDKNIFYAGFDRELADEEFETTNYSDYPDIDIEIVFESNKIRVYDDNKLTELKNKTQQEVESMLEEEFGMLEVEKLLEDIGYGYDIINEALIDAKEIKRINAATDELLNELHMALSQHINEMHFDVDGNTLKASIDHNNRGYIPKYSVISIEYTFDEGTDDERTVTLDTIQLRLANHSYNPANNDMQARSGNFISIVVANDDPTSGRFYGRYNLYFNDDNTVEDVVYELNERIQDIINKWDIPQLIKDNK